MHHDSQFKEKQTEVFTDPNISDFLTVLLADADDYKKTCTD